MKLTQDKKDIIQLKIKEWNKIDQESMKKKKQEWYIHVK